MKKSYLNLYLVSAFLTGFALLSCSSGDEGPSDDTGGGSSVGNAQNVPLDPDSGNHNDSTPDNINPSSAGNTGSDDNAGSGSDNTGSDDNSGSNDSSSSQWKLVFEDNFGNSDDSSISYPDAEYWSLAQKGTDTWNRYMSESYDQAFQKGGYLYLYGQEVNGEYKTGGIESRNKFDFTYGQVKCRARFLRQPQGNHTGIWMMPQSQELGKWPRSGEIDIMEHLDNQSAYFSTVHYYNETAQKDDSSDKEIKVDNDDFNIYGVVWNKDAVAFTLNGKVVFSYKNDDPSGNYSYQYPFQYPFYLILSQSLGGNGTWAGEIDNSALPAIFQIDWIKVWQKQ